MRNPVLGLLAIAMVPGCSRNADEVPKDRYFRALYDAGIEYETDRLHISKDTLLKLSEPVLFRLKGRSCVLFRPRPNVAGRQAVVCFDDQTGNVVESFSP